MEKILKDYAIRIEETIGKTVVVEGCPSLEDAIEFVKKSTQDVRIEMDQVDDFLDRNVFPAEQFTDGTEKGEIVEGQDVSWYETYEYADKSLAYRLVCFKNEKLLYKLKTAAKEEANACMQKGVIKIVNENVDKKQSVIIDVDMASFLLRMKRLRIAGMYPIFTQDKQYPILHRRSKVWKIVMQSKSVKL